MIGLLFRDSTGSKLEPRNINSLKSTTTLALGHIFQGHNNNLNFLP